MLGRRWRWTEDCDDWSAFATWRDARPWAAKVELAAGLEFLLDHGPEHESYKVGDDLYVIYACSARQVLWLLVGVALPGRRLLLPLAWGTGSPPKSTISRAAGEAAEKLDKWRSRV